MPGSEIPDSLSFHSNESNESNSANPQDPLLNGLFFTGLYLFVSKDLENQYETNTDYCLDFFNIH